VALMRPRLPVPAWLERGPQVTVIVDGQSTTAYQGESVAAVLWVQGGPHTRTTAAGEPRGLFCGMGVCFECLVVVDGVPNTRSCVTWVRDGMHITRQRGLGPGFSEVQ
jgi:predicted molibdopterin-dependent oxidoreductase YjgC